MRVQTRLTGISPLVMKNPQLADPENEFVRAIKQITAKGQKMTQDDLDEKARLQFAGALYIGEDGPYMPTTNVRKCFIEGGRAVGSGKNSKGPTVERAVIAVDGIAPLEYSGPRDASGLWTEPRFRYSTMVNGNPSSSKKTLVKSMRPWFPKWSLLVEWELVTEALDYDDFVRIVEVAGVSAGLGDNRRNGFGRFSAEVKKL